MVLRIGVRVPAPQLRSAPRALCRGAAASSIIRVSAPTVLILAAGQGTRMRSGTPKVLHEICGLPMVLWPVRAALAAGAGRVVVVDSPAAGARARCCPEGVELAVQERPDGTGGAVAAALEALGGQLDATRTPVARAERRRAARQRRGDDASWSTRTRDAGAAATMATTVLEDPSGYGRVVRDADGAVERVVETKRQGDSTQAEREIRRGQHGHLRVRRAARCARRCRG